MRRIIQIAAQPAVANALGEATHTAALYALCDDGTLWVLYDPSEVWETVERIPQDGAA